jgi:hypothetical protein
MKLLFVVISLFYLKFKNLLSIKILLFSFVTS